jgi:hypothetical protein
LGPFCLVWTDDGVAHHEIEDQIAARLGGLRVAAWIQTGGRLDQPHQEGDLGRIEFIERQIEEELTGQSEAVDGTAAILAQIDLVGIGLEDLVLAVVQLQQDGHVGFLDLALECAIGGEIEILDQLLGQGTGTLDHGTGLKVAHHSAQDALGIDARVTLEVAILDRHQCLDQKLGQVLTAHQDPVLIVGRIDAGDQHGVQPHQGRISTAIGVG